MRTSKKTELLKQIWDLLPEGKSMCGFCKERLMSFQDFVMQNKKYCRLEQLQSDLDYIKSQVQDNK